MSAFALRPLNYAIVAVYFALIVGTTLSTKVVWLRATDLTRTARPPQFVIFGAALVVSAVLLVFVMRGENQPG